VGDDLKMVMGTLWEVDIALSVVATMVALLILGFYIRKSKEIRSRFTIGLTIFSGILLVQNSLSIFVYADLAQKYSADVAIPLMGTSFLELSALIVLAWLINQ
jgi:multisubunit Na+/H+ antiporter MnhB subunit